MDFCYILSKYSHPFHFHCPSTLLSDHSTPSWARCLFFWWEDMMFHREAANADLLIPQWPPSYGLFSFATEKSRRNIQSFQRETKKVSRAAGEQMFLSSPGVTSTQDYSFPPGTGRPGQQRRQDSHRSFTLPHVLVSPPSQHSLRSDTAYSLVLLDKPEDSKVATRVLGTHEPCDCLWKLNLYIKGYFISKLHC